MNPYKSLPEKQFWKPSVAQLSAFDISGLWSPKFKIDEKSRIVTYGSCFAQHIGQALKARGYGWHVTEKGPGGFPEQLLKRYNYNVFSSRTGNIYTTSLLKQWCEWAAGEATPPEEYWMKGDRYIDPFRPNIEPEGFETVDEMRRSREGSIASFKQSIQDAHYFVFTLGLTESWFNRSEGYEYPMCPGTIAGDFSDELHEFRNQDYRSVLDSLNQAMRIIKGINGSIKFILTVSPVPLVATNSGNHVLVATMHSKSVLRAVAGHVAETRAAVDYFPSYEIINSPVFKGMFFEPNMRSVNPHGVSFVMSKFFEGLGIYGHSGSASGERDPVVDPEGGDVVCEEELLAAFSKVER